ncbi:MAG: FAD-dependent oxidoreductase, partial [Mogibacterium sp.]|nr:FAD-dependent oxidoreductase [Mogibacterium sp.]
TGTVNPWQLGIAAYEHALAHGLVSRLGAKVIGITKEDSGYRICTEREEITASTVVNCAGTGAVKIQEMLYPSPVQLRLDGSDFLVFDPGTPHPSHVVLEETESGKGITAVPCIEGNLLLDSPQRPYRPDNATTAEGLETIREHASRLLPELDLGGVIRSFGGVRPNPEYADGRSVKDFCIERPAVNLWSLIGIKTPGLTCACELGSYIAAQCAELLGAGRNDAFTPYRSAIRAQDGSPILCQCQQITRDEVLEAIRRGAVNIDGVKRRLGTGMGRCQGSRCAFEISRLLTEEGRDGSI